MEFVGRGKEARGEVEDGRMLTFELEAAEALAGLSSYSAVHGEGERRPTQQILSESQDQGIDVQLLSGNTSATVAAPMNNAKSVEAAVGQTCCKSGRSKVCRTPKQNLTEAEKEAQRLSRVLANRESARRTIRRRQTMYLELTGKAANMLEENMYLKKEKELVMKKYNYLKDKNEFLKAEMAKRKPTEAGERREDQSNSSHAEISTAATVNNPPFFLYNHPSFVPFIWPPIVPSSDIFSSQYIPNPDGMMPTWEKPCSDQGQNVPGGSSTEPGTPLVLLPVPLLLPFLTQVGTPRSHPGVKPKDEASRVHQCRTCSSSVAHIQEDNHQLSSNRNVRADSFRHVFLEKNRGRPLMSASRKLKNAIAASEARIKRKELMTLKNRHGDNSRTQ
ncbi:uncharacterized protein LOC142540154 isoform X2 [Primulina tabacum]|uniref:uncharacterized protein LOC142540154 isoform X2 n=1 Tax=Primulina tabacum TaxID=48773 RepID=UPI003F5A0A94